MGRSGKKIAASGYVRLSVGARKGLKTSSCATILRPTRALEEVMEEKEFAGVNILRLALYSAPLNTIEHIWSSVKATIKQEMSASFHEMMNTPPGLTQTEHRLRYLERKIDAAMAGVTPRACLRACNHVQRHFRRCLAVEDLPVGE